MESADVRRVFDAMAGSYDELEPWYVHLYRRLTALIRATLAAPEKPGRRALDVGCGTGFATRLLLELGYATHGVDLSPALVAVARERLPAARLVVGDARRLPYATASVDVVTCCGSTLSFVPHPDLAIGEMARVLRPGGRLLLECEQKWTLDLGWMLASAAVGDPLGYGVSLRALRHALRRPLAEGCWIDYPLALDGGAVARAPLYLFTVPELRAMLAGHGLIARRWWGIHGVTNLLPSTVLHRPALGRIVGAVFGALAALDAAVSATRWAPHTANSTVVLAERGG